MSLVFPFSASAVNGSQYVFEVCDCRFPAEIGAFKHLKAVEARFTLFLQIPNYPVMVREILAERHGKVYRIITLVSSTENNTTGRDGPVIEIVRLNGPYLPGNVIYQLALDQIYMAHNKLNKDN